MDLQLKNKVIIVTGGAQGIGEGITRVLAEEGAIPVIVDKDNQASSHLAEELTRKDLQCHTIILDLNETGSCERIVKECQSVYGRIDGVVNNAGINDGCGLEEGSPEAFRHSVAINLNHYYDLVYYSLPLLKTSHGSIVNISSKTALTGQGGTSGYAAAKGGQLSLTREWAAELSKYGIKVNAIIPAEVDTPQYMKWIKKFPNPAEKLNEIAGKIPLGNRMTTSREIATMVVFLLSAQSAHTTGQWIIVDGGYVSLDRSLT